MEDLRLELERYIAENFVDENLILQDLSKDDGPLDEAIKMLGVLSAGAAAINFSKLFDNARSETFSEMIRRLIRESGKQNSEVYARANVTRQHFSKICKVNDYQPSKSTAIAFAIALNLDYKKTQALLASAGYTLTKSKLADVIVMFFIERGIFDIDCLNQCLYEYDQPTLND